MNESRLTKVFRYKADVSGNGGDALKRHKYTDLIATKSWKTSHLSLLSRRPRSMGRIFTTCRYKDSEFLRIDANVEQILMQGYELRKKLNTVDPGKFITIDGMNLLSSPKIPIRE